LKLPCHNPRHIHTALIRHSLTTIIIQGIQEKGGFVLIKVNVGILARKTASGFTNAPADPLLAPLIRLFEDYLIGFKVDFSKVPVSLDGISDFQKAVLSAARKIPYGKTVSYSTLAKMAGHPRAVRAAASVMRNNPLPIVIPCHRVIRSNGSPGGYAGDFTGEDAALKRRLLQLETGCCLEIER
jgi:methylated-DNA-[protein]-cysteine S-methyltransferase